MVDGRKFLIDHVSIGWTSSAVKHCSLSNHFEVWIPHSVELIDSSAAFVSHSHFLKLRTIFENTWPGDLVIIVPSSVMTLLMTISSRRYVIYSRYLHWLYLTVLLFIAERSTGSSH